MTAKSRLSTSRYHWLVGLVFFLAPGALRAQPPIRIFAAVSLTEALDAAISEYEESDSASRVVPQFGGSSDLARQIIAGAPADLFFSADRRQLDRVVDAGLIRNDARKDVLSNQLVLVRYRDAPAPVVGPEDLDRLDRIAMADPAVVPAGVYARQYLESRGLWARLRKKVVPTLDVRGALAAVASGNVDAGFVYRTDASIESRVKVVFAVPREDGPAIVYSLGLLESSERKDVRRLYDFLRSEAAGKTFARFGFIPLGVASP